MKFNNYCMTNVNCMNNLYLYKMFCRIYNTTVNGWIYLINALTLHLIRCTHILNTIVQPVVLEDFIRDYYSKTLLITLQTIQQLL